MNVHELVETAAWEATIGIPSHKRHAIRSALARFHAELAAKDEENERLRQVADAARPFARPVNTTLGEYQRLEKALARLDGANDKEPA